MSRLAWPGYRATGAEIAEPVDGYLLTIDVPDTSAGEVVTLTFRPPGWRLELAAFALAICFFVVWLIVEAVPRHSRLQAARKLRSDR